jgi:uncharacterized membrane protein YbaN (DUF454 family)
MHIFYTIFIKGGDKAVSRVKKIVLMTLGSLLLGIGAVGLVIPILPTTPFVLCAAGCFSASSPRLYRKLENTRYFGEYIRNYKSKSGVTKRTKRVSLIFLWGMLALSAALARRPGMWIVLAAVGTGVTVHILCLRGRAASTDS